MKKKQAIKHFKGANEVARLLKISRQAVHQWPDIVPIEQAWRLERASGGKLSVRLDDYRMRALK